MESGPGRGKRVKNAQTARSRKSWREKKRKTEKESWREKQARHSYILSMGQCLLKECLVLLFPAFQDDISPPADTWRSRIKGNKDQSSHGDSAVNEAD